MKNLILLALLALSFSFCQNEEEQDNAANYRDKSAVNDTITKVKVQTLAKATQSWNDSTLIPYPEGQPEITILKIDIPPHTELSLHQHPVINAGVITKGQLTVISENKDTLHMNEGDALIELVNTTHYGVNESDETTQIIVFYAGIKDQAITVYTQDH